MRRKPRPGIAPGVPPQCHLHQPSAIPLLTLGLAAAPHRALRLTVLPQAADWHLDGPLLPTVPAQDPAGPLLRLRTPASLPQLPWPLGTIPDARVCPLTSSALSPQGWPLRLPAVAQSGHLGACCMSTLCPDVLLGFVQCGSRVGAL